MQARGKWRKKEPSYRAGVRGQLACPEISTGGQAARGTQASRPLPDVEKRP
jgi:hypothetical protein